MGHPRPLIVYFRSFQTIYRIKTVDFSGIRTRIVWAEGKHGNHLTTTTAQKRGFIYYMENFLAYFDSQIAIWQIFNVANDQILNI